MLKKLLIVSFLFLFAMQFVSAGETAIILKTPEFTEIHLTVLDPGADYSSFAIYKKVSDAYGDAEFIYTGSATAFDLMVVLKKSDKTIYSNKFKNKYIAGKDVYLEVIPEGYKLKETPTISGNVISNKNTNATNSTEKNITAVAEKPEVSFNITEEAVKNKSSIFSFSFLKSDGDKQTKGGQSFNALYIIGAVIVLLAIGFFVSKNYYAPAPRKIKVTKLSDTKLKTFDSKNVNELIGDAADRIKKAQKEIETLKKYKE